MTHGLFRPEAIAHQQASRMGDAFRIETSTLRWFTGAFMLLALSIVLFLCWGDYTRKARVSGFLAPTRGMVKVFTPQQGMVIERKVEEGQRVSKGDELFVLSSDQASLESADAQAAAIAALTAQRDSLLAELEQQDDLNQVQWLDMQTQSGNLQRERDQLAHELKLQEQRIAVATNLLDKFRRLYQQHFVAEVQWQEKQEQALAQQAIRQNLKRNQVTLERDSARLKARIASSRYEFARQRAELDRAISSIDQQITEYQARRSIVITAPASGTVTAILLQEGQLATAQTPLLSILPQGSELQVNLLVPSRAIGFVSPGQRVALRYQAFPYQRFGMQPGEVSEISRTIIKPGEADFPVRLEEPAYRVVVKPSRQTLRAYSRDIPLQAGMLLDADIKLDRRSLLQWIFDPLYSLAGTL